MDDEGKVWCPLCQTVSEGEDGDCPCGGLRVEVKGLDVDVVERLRNDRVATRFEIEVALGYRDLYKRLRSMADRGLIVSHLCNGKMVYAASDGVFFRWARDNMDMMDFFRLLRGQGALSGAYCSVSIHREVYEVALERAKERGMPLRQFTEEALLDKLEGEEALLEKLGV